MAEKSLALSLKLPPELRSVREAASRALSPVLPVSNESHASEYFLFDAKRTNAGRSLPPYYLVYFLLVDLLDFKNLGQFEKIAWSVPVDYRGKAFLIEHRKFGVGVFAQDLPNDESLAAEIVSCVRRATRAATPFFDWLASEAVKTSKLNVNNNSRALYHRLEFFLRQYHEKNSEAHERRDERVVKTGKSDWGEWTRTSAPVHRLTAEARFLALAAIEAFYSWTEHIFIHLAILLRRVVTGSEVADLAAAEWGVKYKKAMDISESRSKDLYDQLTLVRQDLRNFVAHGAFGKQGEAFKFHSGAGAVPVLLPHRRGKSFRLGSGVEFDHRRAMAIIDDFLKHVWTGERKPAKRYIESDLPTILTHSGNYAGAMASDEDMQELIDYLLYEYDRAANMDY